MIKQREAVGAATLGWVPCRSQDDLASRDDRPWGVGGSSSWPGASQESLASTPARTSRIIGGAL
jgi:hypothetical protein